MRERSCKNVLNRLRKSKQSYALFGSRRYDTASPDSDWNFFAAYEQLVMDELHRLGFIASQRIAWLVDKQEARWCHHLVHPINVTLVRDIAVKKKALHVTIKLKEIFTQYLGDYTLAIMWNHLYALIDLQPDATVEELAAAAIPWFYSDGIISVQLRDSARAQLQP